ncbi:MAG: LysR family transcriptional regulator [Microthrixaceae bacterium]|nr:LysR family transcriptional regulator [Microthrixaceae bacterium]MCO5312788.1 LysR family transcriptional regulator [Microthrixaceae bacterium]
MDQRQLRALLAVGEHRSFSAAAKALNTVQSNVSTHVARLERELGVTLIDRAVNELTAEGRVVAERARRIDHEYEALASDVAAMRDVVTGSVRIGIIGTTARWIVPGFLTRLKAHYPQVRVVILDATTSSLVLHLAGGQLDLAIVNTPVEDPELSSEDLFVEQRILVVPLEHPLADRDSVTLAEVAKHEVLISAVGTSFRSELDEAAERVGVRFISKAEIDGMRLLASLAFSGYGAAVLPASAVPGTLDGAWRRVMISDISTRSVGLARRRRGLLSPAERAVAEVIREVVADEVPQQPGLALTGTP